MARTIRVLWIEDDRNDVIIDMQNIVKEEIEDRLYKCKIINVKNVEEAYNAMKKSYVDIIFSDFNLEEDGKTGLDLLVELRTLNNFKFYVLYSNNPQLVIIKDVTDKINEKKKMKLFSNFNFFSAGGDYISELDEIIQQFMDERSKIEQLRNIYIITNAILEDQISVSGCDYCECIDKFVKENFTGEEEKDILSLWHGIRKERNAFAHGSQVYSDNNWKVSLNGLSFNINSFNYKDYLEKISKLEKILEEKGLVLFNKKDSKEVAKG